jgi:prepilin-type N-terminal cleavage/methylation domain-containing protein
VKGESGFSLLEVVISTAVLALLSGFILQMFIESIYLNQKAYNLDMSANAAAGALEALKAGETPDSGALAPKYFDSQWRQIAVIQAEPDELSQNVNLLLPDNVKFILTAEASEDRAYESETYTSFDLNGNYIIGSARAGIYKLGAVVYEVKAGGGREEIVRLSTFKYRQSG